jgi:hypothetical protein
LQSIPFTTFDLGDARHQARYRNVSIRIVMMEKPRNHGRKHALAAVIVERCQDVAHGVEIATHLRFGFHFHDAPRFPSAIIKA